MEGLGNLRWARLGADLLSRDQVATSRASGPSPDDARRKASGGFYQIAVGLAEAERASYLERWSYEAKREKTLRVKASEDADVPGSPTPAPPLLPPGQRKLG